MTATPWLDTINNLIGTTEIPGPTSNPIILEFARFVGERFPDMKNYSALYRDDDTAWCGVVLAFVMAKAGIRPPFGATDVKRFMWAYSWTDFGMKLDVPRLGCVMVLKRPGGYHVSLYGGDADADHVWSIGGNQGNTISKIRWPKNDIVGCYWPSMAAVVAPTAPVVNSTLISKQAFDEIVADEVSSKAVFEKKYQQPIWPGASSGITVGIGYDVGANPSSLSELRADWKGKIPDAMIDRLATGLHITGPAAKNLLPMDDVTVPWGPSIDVFANITLPKYYNMTARALPNFEKLSLHCKGALVSLVYNRGASFDIQHDPEKDPNDRYREMRAIKAAMVSENFAAIPGELRKMKRLWNLAGLLTRREREALLFEKGLKTGGGVIGTIITTGIVVGGGNAANEISKPEPDYTWIVIVGFIVIAIAIGAIFIAKKIKDIK